MLNLIDLLNFLNNKTNNIDTYINSLKNSKRLKNKMFSEYGFTVSNLSYNDSLNNLLYCLLNVKTMNYHLFLDLFSNINIANEIESDGFDNYDRKIISLDDSIINQIKSKLIDDINNLSLYSDTDIIDFNLFNKKKMLQSINNSQYTHELIIIIALILDVNIFIFYKDINLFKVYYSEN